MFTSSYLINNIIKVCGVATSALVRDMLEIQELQTCGRNIHGFVASADSNVENILMEGLNKIYPKHNYLCEESGYTVVNKDAQYRWIIDPIDGTSNFLHSYPNFAISVALQSINSDGGGSGGDDDNNGDEEENKSSDVGGRSRTRLGFSNITNSISELSGIVAAVVYMPITRDIYWAELGRGAYYIDSNRCQTKMKVAQRTQYDDLLFASIIQSAATNSQEYQNVYSMLMQSMSRVRVSGSISTDCTMLAGGKLDLCLYNQSKIWDVAAGSLIVSEAGGNLCTIGGNSRIADNDDAQSSNHSENHTINNLLLANKKLLAKVASHVYTA